MKNTTTHLIMALLWGIYGIIIGSLVVVFHYNNLWSWLSIVVAISGNSVHLVTMDFSKSGIEVKSQAVNNNPPKP